jgi:nucleoside phosphorylase
MDSTDEVMAKIKLRAKSGRVLGSPRSVSEERVAFSEPMQNSKEQFAISEDGPADRTISQADVAVVTALGSPELDQVLRVFGPSWQKEGRDGVVFNRTTFNLNGTDISVVAAVQTDMGMVPATILAVKTMQAWRPRVLAMTGICAGVKGKVNLGDVVIGRQVFDYGSGKLEAGRLTPDYQPVSLDDHMCSIAQDLARARPILNSIKESWPQKTGRPQTELQLHVGTIASGAAVVADDSVVEGIQEHKRSLHAIDMEAYGAARAATSSIIAAKPLIIKGVQDFADEKKSDEFREYSAYVSAKCLHEFLLRYWPQIDS